MQVRIYRLKMKHLQKKKNKPKQTQKKGCAVFSTLQLQAGKDPKPNNRAGAVPIKQNRYNRHC